MRENKLARELMSNEEFKEYLNSLVTLEGVYKFRSFRRAVKRGNALKSGVALPRRPYNNRANTSKRRHTHSRVLNERKKSIYGRIAIH